MSESHSPEAVIAVTRQRTISSKAPSLKAQEAGLAPVPVRSLTTDTTLTTDTSASDAAMFTRSWNRFLRKGKKKIPFGESMKNFAFSSGE
jgi:hypothetical protein